MRQKVYVIYGTYDNLFEALKEMIKLSVDAFKIGRERLPVMETIKFMSEYGYGIQKVTKGHYQVYGTHDREIFERYIGFTTEEAQA